jgi:hypothetical protein
MTKHRVTVEFDVPDNTPDLCWEGPHAGPQIFHDIFVVPSMAQLTLMYGDACHNSTEEFQNYIKTKLNILLTVKYEH